MNSSTVSLYFSQASSRLMSPPFTAATTSAFLRMTHLLVELGGRSVIVNGAPSGPMTKFSLEIRFSIQTP